MSTTNDLLDDPRLTAYALGELQGAERAEVEALLARDDAARRVVEEVRRTASAVAAGLGAAGGASLTSAQRAKIAARARGPASVVSMRRFYWTAAAALVVGAVAGVATTRTWRAPQGDEKATARADDGRSTKADGDAVGRRLKELQISSGPPAGESGKSRADFDKLAAAQSELQSKFEQRRPSNEADRKADWIHEDPMFKTVELTRIVASPYVVFQEVKKEDVRDTKRTYDDKQGAWREVPIDGTSNPAKVKQNEEWAKKGELFAKRDAVMFTELNRRFRELFAAEYRLPALEEKGRMLTGVVMWNRDSFDKLLKEAGNPVSPGIRAFYSPRQQKIFHYLSDESLQELDEIACADGHVQKEADQVTFHEGTHQLLHEYAAIYQGRPLQNDDEKVPDRRAMWFEEGIAEFMGAVEVEEGKTEFLKDVKWFHNRIHLSRILEARADRENVEKWRIKDFMKPDNNQDLATLGERLVPGGAFMSSHFYCRVWAFCHFLWYYDNGKYRPMFMDYLKEVLNGTQSSEKFAKIMKRKNANDWGPIEMEYEWYWDQLLMRYVGKSRRTGKWERPSTEAPTGKVEDPENDEWRNAWTEAHKDDGK